MTTTDLTHFYKKVSKQEYEIYKYVHDLQIINIPKLWDYNESTGIMITEKIPNMSVSDYYGDNPTKVPKWIFNEIRKIVTTLYKHNVEYIDITGYNFIEHENKIWIIDFGHATFINPKIPTNDFLKKFMKKKVYEWNSDFM